MLSEVSKESTEASLTRAARLHPSSHPCEQDLKPLTVVRLSDSCKSAVISSHHLGSSERSISSHCDPEHADFPTRSLDRRHRAVHVMSDERYLLSPRARRLPLVRATGPTISTGSSGRSSRRCLAACLPAALPRTTPRWAGRASCLAARTDHYLRL
nr:hypothetical protein CFP56_72036 [Quercus suber]